MMAEKDYICKRSIYRRRGNRIFSWQEGDIYRLPKDIAAPFVRKKVLAPVSSKKDASDSDVKE